MSFYTKRASYADYRTRLTGLRTYLRTHGKVINIDDPNITGEVYLFDSDAEEAIELFYKQYGVLRYTDMVYIMPFYGTPDNPGFLIYFPEDDTVPKPTVSKSHIRLPKLSFLVTLIPDDFFAILKIIAEARPASPTTLTIDPMVANIHDLGRSSIGVFFTLLKTNYRMNADYADRKWTAFADIKAVADLEPTRDNQLSAIQYLTALQNDDLVYFPVESMINLDIGLDWPQISDDYAVPPGR